ncbi:MAG: HAMP domain-containing protein [Clostridia bacterium]|nr:HAMP domain-containing protein [Clostridia bacterium]
MPRTVFRKRFRSMRLAMLAATVLAVGLAIGAFALVQLVSNTHIKNIYVSDEKKAERELEYAKQLQEYVTDNNLSSEDVAKLASWAQSNRYLYVMIEKEDKLIFETGSKEPEETPDGTEPGENPDDPNGGLNPDDPGEDVGPDDPTDDPNGADGENGDGNDEEDDSIGSGITVVLPSREELLKKAREKGAHHIETSDAPGVLVYMADFSEYLYYDIANVSAMIVAVIVLVTTVLLYSHGVTRRITGIAKDVSRVAAGDMDHSITPDGKDELGRLSRDVESMRSTMLENVKKEREAMDANAELVTSMSHDIRTPLTVLLGYLDIMKLHAPSDEMMSYINASEKTALRLKKLSDDMFSYFLLFGGGAAEVDMQDYDAGTLVDQMLSEHVLLLTEQGYTVETDMSNVPRDGIIISTDANLLQRIVENLMSNILKYADRERPITLSGRVEDGMLAVTVENFIPAVISNADSNRIGLKTCVKLARLMDAELTASEADGKFTVLLKLPIKAEKDEE